MSKMAELLERAMQVIVALRWGAHHTGEVHPEVEAEVRETLSQLYGAKRDAEHEPATETPPAAEDARRDD
jgi:hypothetical protein